MSMTMRRALIRARILWGPHARVGRNPRCANLHNQVCNLIGHNLFGQCLGGQPVCFVAGTGLVGGVVGYGFTFDGAFADCELREHANESGHTEMASADHLRAALLSLCSECARLARQFVRATPKRFQIAQKLGEAVGIGRDG